MSYTPEQLAVARTIIQTGQRLGASDRDILIALMTAQQESSLRNLNYGDRDSLGVFQQRSAWGSASQRTNVAEATRMFFEGGHAGQRGLFDIGNRNQLALTQAAQAVQVSAYPDAYAKWQQSSQDLLKQFGVSGKIKGTLAEAPGINSWQQAVQQGNATDVSNALGVPDASMDPSVSPSGNALTFDQSSVDGTDLSGAGDLGALSFGMTPFPDSKQVNDPMQSLHMPMLSDFGYSPSGEPLGSAANGWQKRVVNIARQYLGTPYVWGGASPQGFDCSGLVQYVYNQLGIHLPHLSSAQAQDGRRIPVQDAQPGDLIAYDNSSRNVGADHIAIYIGNGLMIEAPHPGADVRISKVYAGNNWAVRLNVPKNR